MYASFQYSKDKEQYLESELEVGLEDEFNAEEEEEAVDDQVNDDGGSQASCAGLMSPEKLPVEIGSPRLQRFPTSSTPYPVSFYPGVKFISAFCC